MHEDDREEEISQSDAEPVKKVTINDASTSLSVVTTLTLKACDEKSVVDMNTPDQNANAGEELVFVMMLDALTPPCTVSV